MRQQLAAGFLLALISTGAPALTATAQPARPRAQATAQATGDPVAGALLYERRCTSCHALDVNRIGPLHRGVVGRRAGTVPGFAYSQALRNSGLTWTEANLDRFLTNPPRLVPMTRMGLSLPLAADRQNVIAYLRQQAVATPR